MRGALMGLVLAGCYLQQYPVTPTVADASTYEMFAGNISGTAFAIDDSHLLTAGHMCDHGTAPYVLVSSTGRKVTGHPVVWEMSGDGTSDLCLIKADGPLGLPMVLSAHMPDVGEPVGYVGYPLGDHTVEQGKYLGDMDGPDAHENDYAFSTHCDHGASGSAVFTKHGVFGVLVRMRTDADATHTEMYVHDGTDGCVVTPLSQIRSMLQDAGVTPTDEPDPLPEPEEHSALG